ncbi:hypothetical protein VTK73DRAFT_8910 [Phialemonium thermophilum]|uniref:Uncharacterized protein n=1 Tax=Phialemonium thermophilum TaxID=223376 RepID=A0ABR3W5E1_9PEZI
MATVREALAWPLPRPVNFTPPGPNTEPSEPVFPSSWVEWSEFNHEILSRIFRRELDKLYLGAPPLPAHPEDLRIYGEDTVTGYLYQQVWPIVNQCLAAMPDMLHIGPGKRDGLSTDWDCVKTGQHDVRCLVGDTKVHAKWQPDMLKRGERNYNILHEWRKVVGQVQGYAVREEVRYAFIVSDEYLVVLRLVATPIDDTHVTTRSMATAAGGSGGHQRVTSDSSMASLHTATGSLEMSSIEGPTVLSTSMYDGTDPSNLIFEFPEYRAIHIADSGSNRLTYKAALFYLALMAGHGENDIGFWYPPLDSYRVHGKGGYIHVTSGRRKKRLTGSDVLAEPIYASNPVDAGPEEFPHRTDNYDETEYGAMENVVQEADTANVGHQVAADAGEGPSQPALPVRPVTIDVDSGGDADTQRKTGAGDTNTESADNRGDENTKGDEDRGEEGENQPDTGNDNSRGKGKAKAVDNVPTGRINVVVKQHTFRGGFYYVNVRGEKVDTHRSKWAKVSGGYELRGRRHTYFTTSFPR